MKANLKYKFYPTQWQLAYWQVAALDKLCECLWEYMHFYLLSEKGLRFYQ